MLPFVLSLFGRLQKQDRWENNADQIVQIMAGMNCEAGATQIEKVFAHAINESQVRSVKCVVYIGDAMEENVDFLASLSGKLGLLNIPVFIIQCLYT